jgi:NADH-quinone oxidoreductase subunit E
MSQNLGGAAGSQVANGTSEDIGDGSTGLGAPQPAHFAFDDESNREIELILTKYPPGRKASAVLPLLYVVQHQMRRQTGSAWVPTVAMDVVADRLEMPPIRVYEVATFYLMFNTNPIGRYHLQVCGTTPCWLRGSDEITRACRDETGIKAWRETSADGMFTMSEVECVGACVNAPILQVDDDYHEDLDYDRTVALLQALRRGETVHPGSSIGRMTSAPEGGPTTLTTLE